MARETAQFVLCDAPKCNVRREHDDAEPAIGIFINAGGGMLSAAGGGGPLPELYACKLAHVGAAIEARFWEEWHR